MNKLIQRVIPGLLVSLLILSLAACGGAAAPEAASVESETGTMAATAPAPKNFAIEVEPIGHWHVSGAKTLLFTVADANASARQDIAIGERSAEGGIVVLDHCGHCSNQRTCHIQAVGLDSRLSQTDRASAEIARPRGLRDVDSDADDVGSSVVCRL